jgi:predicted RNA-binding Zn-ribbon protein involved in translation (DUF1610 family)
MRKEPKRKPRSARLGDATQVGYCPRCGVSTTQRITSAPTAGKEVWRTAICEQCGWEIERTILPELPNADDEYTPEQRRIIDAQLAEGLADIKAGRTFGPFDSAGEMIAHMKARLRKKATGPKAKRSR